MLDHRLATPITQPKRYFFDKNGKPLVGGKIYSYKVGEDEFKPTYRNSEFTAANQNPILLDSAGSALIYMRGSVQLKIYDKFDQFIGEQILYQQEMIAQFFDHLGKPLSNGQVWTFDYQSTLKKPSYQNADEALLNPNPVLLDENGRASISMIGAYRLRQYNKNGVFVADQDFKRPPTQVLTSKPYPVDFKEGISTNLSLIDGTQRLTVNSSVINESVNTQFLLVSATVKNIVQKHNMSPESVAVQFSITGATVEIYDPYKKTPLLEEINTSFLMAKATTRNALITHKDQAELLSTSFAIVGAKIIN